VKKEEKERGKKRKREKERKKNPQYGDSSAMRRGPGSALF
jgi:hypothetical protein